METEKFHTFCSRGQKINSNLCQMSHTFVKEVDNGLEKIMKKKSILHEHYILRKIRATVELNFINHFYPAE